MWRSGALAVLVLVLGGCVADDAPPGPAALLAFGDSVAAGHGLGLARGYPGNPDGAFPSLVAQDLGLWLGNFAISGACAATSAEGAPGTPDSCLWSVLRDELPGLWLDSPEVVLVTVGANDIGFVDCLIAFYKADVAGDPCRGDEFERRLSAFRLNLDAVLGEIERTLRPGRVAVTLYYNFFPEAATVLDEACDAFGPAAISRNNAMAAVPHGSEPFRRAVLEVQAEGWEYSSRVVGALNEAISEVGRAHGALLVPFDASGHDMCATVRGLAQDEAWVFGPAWDDGPAAPGTAPLRYEAPALPGPCPFTAQDPDEMAFPVGVTNQGQALGYELRFRANCIGHPTPSGHRALADQVLEVLGTGR
jgi:lysophospholipase L1-like esterase